MVQFLGKRFIGLIFVILGVTFITFIMGYFAPGDPMRVQMGQHFNPVLYARLRHAYGLDLPWYQQYYNFLVHLFQFDLGRSFKYPSRSRLARTCMLEVLRQDYVRTARAKGLRELAVIYRHALLNAMIPLVTVLGLSIGLLVTGAFFIENIFNIPGIAYATITSINDRDYPVIQATAVLFAVAVVVGNFIADVLYTVVDPRIRAEQEAGPWK